jgi:peptide/nickel transport system permease protein
VADTAPTHRARPRAVLLAIAQLFIAVIVLLAAATALGELGAVVQVIVGLGGLALAFHGFRALGRSVLGPGFDPGLVLSLVWFGLVVLAATFADLLPLAEARDVSQTLTTPSLMRPDLLSAHPLGTDRLGLDILGGIIYGARISLVVGFGAVLIGMAIGTATGIAAGFYRGRFEASVNLVVDSMLAFPPLILLLAVVAVLTASIETLTIALAILGVPTYVRLAKANTLVFAQREFVLAARALGDTNRSIMARELLPNVLLPVVSYGFIVVAVMIVAEASLSFLGLSIPRPQPTWGNMISAGQADFQRHPHLVAMPGLALFLTVYSLNRIGEKARALWDPRQQKL